MSRTGFAALLLGASLLSGAAMAETITFHAKLDGATEVPPKTTAGTGEAMVTLDTAAKTVTYNVTYSGLSGPATMGHIHGPAAPGANAGVVVPFANAASPISGKATLTDAQIADLEAGKYYVNVHTAANPAGEIRGQLVK
jgi:hypothetical protein